LLALLHATPAAQQVVPHGVVPAGHPQTPLRASTHAMPRLQQHGPHDVVPPAHGAAPATDGPLHVTAAARKGFSTVAAVAPTAAAPNSLISPRRLWEAAIALVRSSKRSLMRSVYQPTMPLSAHVCAGAFAQGVVDHEALREVLVITMLIRERRESDVGACLEMAEVLKGRDGYPPRGPIDIEHFLAPDDQLAAWVAEDGTDVVGHVALHASGDYATTRVASEHLGCSQSELGLIARLFVDPRQRRSGAGRALLTHATNDAVERGLRPVLDVATELDAAVALYEALGWQRVGEVVLTVWDEPPLAVYVYVARADS
jgi:GNAT superfamily N-acetyltransferase